MHSLLLPVVIPAAVGLLVLVMPARLRNVRTVLGIFGALATLVAAAFLLSLRETVTWPWIHFGGIEIDFNFSLADLQHVELFQQRMATHGVQFTLFFRVHHPMGPFQRRQLSLQSVDFVVDLVDFSLIEVR